MAVKKTSTKKKAVKKKAGKRPAKSSPSYVTRKSQATGKAPSARLKARRKKARTAPKGYFPNPSAPRYVAIKLDAGHDRSGNPRRIWVILDTVKDAYVASVPEGYRGPTALKETLPARARYVEAGTFRITATEYNALIKSLPRTI